MSELREDKNPKTILPNRKGTRPTPISRVRDIQCKMKNLVNDVNSCE